LYVNRKYSVLKKLLFKYLLLPLLVITTLVNGRSAFGQTVTISPITGTPGNNGTATSPLLSGDSQKAIFGFSVQVASGSVTFKQFNIAATGNSTPSAVLANGTLYRTTTNTYTAGAAGNTAVGNVNFNGATSAGITITNLAETISSTTNFYFLVVDVIGTGGIQPSINNDGNNYAFDTNNVGYGASSGAFPFYNLNTGTAYPVSLTSTEATTANPAAGMTSTATSLTSGSANLPLFSFSLTTTTAATFTALNINSTLATLSSYFSGFKLYSNTTNTFTGATQVATMAGTISGGFVKFTGTMLTSATPTYYFLVGTVAFTGSPTVPATVQFKITDAQATNAALIRSLPSSATYNDFTAYGDTYTLNYANVTVTAAQNGLSGSTITSGQTAIAMFGFGVNAGTSTITLSGFNINSNTSSISTYFGNGKLYRNTSNTFTGSTQIAGAGVAGTTVTFSGNFATVTGLSQSVGAANVYYFLVADNIGGATGSPSVNFSFSSGQSSAAVIESSPNSTSYNNFTITGNSYTLPAPTVNFTINTTGVNASSSIFNGQTGVVLYGVNAAPTGNISITSPYIHFNSSNGNPLGYFPAATLQLWVSTSGSYATASQVSGVTFDQSAGIRAFLSSTLSLSAGTTYTYYLVGTLTPGASTMPTTFPISVDGILSNNGGSSFSASLATTTYNLINGNVTIADNNTTADGITANSNIAYGQTGIVLFGFQLQAQGTFTISSMSIPSTNDMGQYFTNGKLYRSNDQFFSNAVQVPGTISYNSGSAANISGMSEAFSGTSTTTYYYFITADLTATTSFATPKTVAYNFASGQTPVAISTGSSSFNTFTTTQGKTFNIVSTYDWVGTTNDFTNKSNFAPFNGSPPVSTLPNSSITVLVGVNKAYTTAPSLPSGTSIGGLSISNAKVASPAITVATGTSTLASGLTILNGATVTINGPGTLAIGSSGVSSTSTSSTLALAGGVTISNAGTFTTGTSSNITLAGSSTLTNSGTFTLASTAQIGSVANSTIANTGTGVFTLASDASSTAAIGQLTGTSTITGNFSAQRFITGGAGKRGYRLLSSPTYTGTANSNNVYSLNYVANSSYLTGTSVTTGGIDKAGNPSLWLFRESLTPNQSSFTSGNYRGVGSMGTTGTSNIGYSIDNETGTYNVPVGNGFLFFFRGDRTQASLANETITSYVPTNTVLSTLGPINTGTITFKSWYTPLVGNLLYTNTTTPAPGNGAIRGYNLAGNPYPSSINWTTVNAASTNVSPIMYQYNPATSQYGFYDAVHLTSSQNVSNIIGSGEGFFVIAANSSPAVLTFTEAAKASTSQPSTLLLGVPVGGKAAPQYVHLKMVKDAVNFDDVVISLSSTADEKYVNNEDAVHLAGNSPPETLTALSSDSVGLSGDVIPMPIANKPKTVRLTVNATASGLYTFNRSELVGIPPLYEIWLKDNLQKDSLDLRANTNYSFLIDKNDAATFGANRFQIVIRENPALGLHLLDFTADKVTGVNTPQVAINWKVENESNYTTFYVQRSTDGGQTFQSIGSLQSDGSGSYSFVDKSPVLTQDQYRLQLSDADNNLTYSSIVTVEYAILSNANLATISLYPNPVHDVVNITITNTTTASNVSYTITITNSSGTIITTATSTQSTYQNNVSNLLPGTYFIQVVDNNSKAIVGRSKFVKL